MSDHSTYEFMRQFADSWGLVVMFIVFVVLAAWPFRKGAGKRNQDAANVIFKDDADDQ